jgi:hypothetical protein
MTNWKPGMSFTIRPGRTDTTIFEGIIMKIHDEYADVIFTDGAIFNGWTLTSLRERGEPNAL